MQCRFYTPLDKTGRTASLLSIIMVAALLLVSATASADVVLDWNAIAVETAVANSANPFAQARYAAIVQLAVFEAVNSITGQYQPYLGTIVAPSGASPDAAAAQAAHNVLVHYFQASQATLDNQLAASLAQMPDGQAKTDGIAVGQAAAAAMIALRASDGSAPAKFYTPGPPVPGAWQATPSCPVINGIAVGAFYHWQNVTPFGIPDAHAYLLAPPPELTSNLYAKAYNEVMTVGSLISTERSQDRADVVHFYAASSPTLVFNQAAQQVAQERAHSPSENARALALINMAISDAAVATFDTKYHYKFWRPETAIHNAALDGNDKTPPDATYTPFIPTPCFPGYPSAHGVLSNSAREVMENLYAPGPISITLSTTAVPGVTLRYTTLTQITDDIADARVYGGIHFRTDQDAGEKLGERVGQYIYTHNLRPAHGKSGGR